MTGTHPLKSDETKGYPQVTFKHTSIAPNSFYGSLRTLFSDVVLKTQLEQIRKQGSYDAFKLKWHPAYDEFRLHGAVSRVDWGLPPSLFWASDVAKWIESVAYFLHSPGGEDSKHAAEFRACVDELVDMIAAAQQADGYLDLYFMVVDPKGRFKNLRDMHEMYNAGHLLEGALAWYDYSGDRKLLDVMVRYIDLLMATFGPGDGQIHGYCGHPEIELAVLRLYDVTKDPRHLEWANYLLAERGRVRDGQMFFEHEANARGDMRQPLAWPGYFSELPLAEQDDIHGHAVRAFYLWTAAADAGGTVGDAARRVWTTATARKMYVTGGFGSEPMNEAFARVDHRLPQSTAQGGCYAETCASIAAMMCGERLLQDRLDGSVRDVVELAFLNAVMGGASLDGKSFAYDNKLATCGDEVATRCEWFTVCCCPPNLSRTFGMLGGYVWKARVDAGARQIDLDVLLFVAATRTIDLGEFGTATARLDTDMPWHGRAKLVLDAPEGWTWQVRLPSPEYAENVKLSVESTSETPGYLTATTPATATVDLAFDLPVRLLASHPATGYDTVTVTRGPIVYVAESVDNDTVNNRYPHFEGLGLSTAATFEERAVDIGPVSVVQLTSNAGSVAALDQYGTAVAHRRVTAGTPARTWTTLPEPLKLVPWFARANRSKAGKAHVRTSFLRVD